MWFTSVLFFFYFLILFLFSLITHPVYYCGLLVVNSLICRLIIYSIFGFSWYSLIFCLIYIGGVYILFVFISVHSPNRKYVSYFSLDFSVVFFLIFCFILISCIYMYIVIKSEFSRFLCSLREGKFYVSMCLTLLFGFLVLRLVMSVKINYYR